MSFAWRLISATKIFRGCWQSRSSWTSCSSRRSCSSFDIGGAWRAGLDSSAPVPVLASFANPKTGPLAALGSMYSFLSSTRPGAWLRGERAGDDGETSAGFGFSCDVDSVFSVFGTSITILLDFFLLDSDTATGGASASCLNSVGKAAACAPGTAASASSEGKCELPASPVWLILVFFLTFAGLDASEVSVGGNPLLPTPGMSAGGALPMACAPATRISGAGAFAVVIGAGKLVGISGGEAFLMGISGGWALDLGISGGGALDLVMSGAGALGLGIAGGGALDLGASGGDAFTAPAVTKGTSGEGDVFEGMLGAGVFCKGTSGAEVFVGTSGAGATGFGTGAPCDSFTMEAPVVDTAVVGMLGTGAFTKGVCVGEGFVVKVPGGGFMLCAGAIDEGMSVCGVVVNATSGDSLAFDMSGGFVLKTGGVALVVGPPADGAFAVKLPGSGAFVTGT
mmetsp:Transcript_388/g.711  ORF Transcript_388/g.711 Transcript_388/m.711 type:complete len:453 (+) Transcript_388:125-1483(+)